MSRIWSKYQQAIFDAATQGRDNLVIEAVAGSGKTTTLVELIQRLNGSTIFLAFNKAIAEELKARGVNARTFHSLTYRPVLQAQQTRAAFDAQKPRSEVKSNKLRELAQQKFSDAEYRLYGSFAIHLVGLARQQGIGAGLAEDTEENWTQLAEHHDLEPESTQGTFAAGIAAARKLLEVSNASTETDFDDLLYLAVKEGVSLPKFDNVLVDEAQDTNAIQRAILCKILKPGARLIAVGDPAQAIYGFRGADSDSLELISTEFNARRLPLSVSYRCPRAVIQQAQAYVSHIEAANDAPEGVVESLGEVGQDFKIANFVANDLVVCRNTRPLIALAYQLLRARIPARVLGREIGQGLISLIEKLNARGIDGLLERLGVYTAREVEKAIAKKDEAKAAAIQDKTNTIYFLIDSLGERERTIPALIAAIESLFSDVRNAVVFATIHKAKGLEAEHVYWLNSSNTPSPWARSEWQLKQEHNLAYVAITRAKQTLSYIELPDSRREAA